MMYESDNKADMNSMPARAQERPSIFHMTEVLQKQVENLMAIHAELEGRIRPVLRPVPDVDDRDPGPVTGEPMSDIMGTMRLISRRLDEVTGRFVRTLDSVEL